MARFITQLTLLNFRNHKYFQIKPEAPLIILSGKNGTGKTNILEAISLLSPGRGLNSANTIDMINRESQNANISISLEEDVINTNLTKNKKIIQINKKNCKLNKDLLEIIRVLWLIPAMSSLFTAPKELRRNFFDRLIFSFDTKHASNILRYEHAKAERAKLLQVKGDNNWLLELEHIMATTAIKIINIRNNVINLLQKELKNNLNKFPTPHLYIVGKLEQLVSSVKEEELPYYIQEIFQKNRSIDLKLKRTTFGPHCSDFMATYLAKKIGAEFCSTGEQKSMVISILLAAIQKDTILLLDDVSSNLDSINLNYLLENVIAKGCQIWLTDNKVQPFEHFNSYQHLIPIE